MPPSKEGKLLQFPKKHVAAPPKKPERPVEAERLAAAILDLDRDVAELLRRQDATHKVLAQLVTLIKDL